MNKFNPINIRQTNIGNHNKEIILMNTGKRVQFTLEPTVYEMAKGKALRLRNIPVDRLNGEVSVFKIIFEITHYIKIPMFFQI